MVVGRVSLGGLDANGRSYADGNVVADLVQLGDDVLLDSRADLARLETDGVDEELLLDFGERVVEETRLGPVVGKGLRALADEGSRGLATGSGEEPASLLLVCLLGEALVQRVGRVCFRQSYRSGPGLGVVLHAAVFLWIMC